MPRKRYTPEEIVSKLRRIELMMARMSNLSTLRWPSAVGGFYMALGLALAMMGSPVPAQAQPIEIRFDARVNDQPFACGVPYFNVGKNGATLLPQDFRLYISDVRLLRSDGAEVLLALTRDDNWQSDRVALLDFENDTANCAGSPAMNAVIRGSAPQGAYSGLVFTIGVPEGLNHQDPTLAAAPLNRSGMFWPWRIGYKFTSIAFDSIRPEGTSSRLAGEESSTYSLVLGSMDCGDGAWDRPPSESCRSPNRVTVRLANFDVGKDVVVLDAARLFADSDLSVRPQDASTTCWSFVENDACVPIMRQIGLPFRNSVPAGLQNFVRRGQAPVLSSAIGGEPR